jgi:hypothetical protein
MGAVANNLAIPADFEYNGQIYKVSPWTYEIQGIFERYLEQKAVEGVRRMKSYLTPDEYDKALKSVLADIGLQTYTFGTEEVGKALSAPENVEHIFWLCVNKFHPELIREDVREMSKTHYDQMIAAMNVANTDPNLRKAKTEKTPSPSLTISSPA